MSLQSRINVFTFWNSSETEMSAVKCTLELLLQAWWLNYIFWLFCWQLLHIQVVSKTGDKIVRLWYAISEFILVIVICINFPSLTVLFPVSEKCHKFNLRSSLQLQTIYKFYKEVNIKSKTGIDECGRKCRIPTTIVQESTEADYRAYLSIEGEMLGVQHVFLSKSEFSSRVCLRSSTSPCNEISIANGFVFVVIVIQPFLITCNSNRIEKKSHIMQPRTDHYSFHTSTTQKKHLSRNLNSDHSEPSKA